MNLCDPRGNTYNGCLRQPNYNASRTLTIKALSQLNFDTEPPLLAEAVPLTLIESTLLLSTLRCLSRDPGLPPLPKIGSLVYFLSVIEELTLQPPPDDYNSPTSG